MSRRLLLILLLLGTLATAQQPPIPPLDLERFIEDRLGLPQEDADYANLYESLLLAFSQPLDLNKIGATELESLQLLSPAQIQSFLFYRRHNGPLLSLYELQAIPGFDLPTIRALLPFVRLAGTAPLEGNSRRGLASRWQLSDRYLLLRYQRTLESRRGYQARADSLPPAYGGSPDQLLLRLRVRQARNFSLGLTAEKDAGEALAFDSTTAGADFYSFHLQLRGRGRLNQLLLGDFQAQWGQGLVSGAGFYLGKGARAVSSIMRPSTGLQPYRSALENGFFRGLAASFRAGPRVNVSLLLSRLANDASPPADSLAAGELLLTSLRSSGLHRTAGERAGKNSLLESNVGLNAEYNSANQLSQWGASLLYTSLNRSLKPAPRPYNQHYFRGRQHLLGSLYSRLYRGSSTLFAELALSSQRDWALLAGGLTALNRQLSLSVLLRRYGQRFHSFYGLAFSEGSRLQNETGLYLGLNYQPDPRWTLSAYLDRFWFPAARYGAYAPSEGFDGLLRMEYQPNKQVRLYGQLRSRQKERNVADQRVYRLAAGLKRQLLLNAELALSPHLTIRSRWQGSWYRMEGTPSRGEVLLQDISYRRPRWSLSTRLALFYSQDYENRQYVLERDVRWAFSVPAYYGRGWRYYLLLKAKLGRQWRLGIRWARTRYRDRNAISSGNQRIAGPRQSELKAQLIWHF